MAEKTILLSVANFPMAGELQAALGQSWTVTVAASGPETLAALEKQSFGVLLADCDLFGTDGRECHDFLQKTNQRTIQLLLGADAGRARVQKTAPGQHLFIAKPCDAAGLKTIIERAISLEIWTANEDIRKLVSQVGELPAVSPLFLEIQAALQSSKAPARQIGDLIARDTAATAKLLRVFNSAGFGGSRQITDLHQAVGVLGGQLAQWIVAAIALFNEYDRVKTAYFSMDQLWRSSIAVARLARDLALRHTGDAALADSAFAAGLLHDVGKAVLAGAFDEQYQAVQMVAREQQAPVWKIEKKNFGASHGEIGAYLLSLWGMPLDLLEAVTLHDHPSRSVNPRFSPLTAVHIAHVWEDELNTENDGTPAPQIDGTYLDEVGILDRLAGWRKSMSLPVSNQPVTTSVHRQAGQRAKSMPLGKCRRAPFFGGGGWPLAAAGAFILLLLGWFAFGPIVRVAAKFHGRAADGAAAESATETPRSNAVAPVAATNASTIKSVETPTADMVFPELKLSGIFFSLDRPSAIINGQLVHINGEVAGVHVVEIGPSRVTVEYQQHKKTLSL